MEDYNRETGGRGLVIVNTGSGKGKTTAALGLLLRAHGWGLKVVMFQFIKSASLEGGERRAARALGVEIVAGGDGFTWESKDKSRSKALALDLWERARKAIAGGEYGMVILDELGYPLSFGWIALEPVLEAIKNRPASVHVVITGASVPAGLKETADIVTEMREVKHCFREGVRAQAGIEF